MNGSQPIVTQSTVLSRQHVQATNNTATHHGGRNISKTSLDQSYYMFQGQTPNTGDHMSGGGTSYGRKSGKASNKMRHSQNVSSNPRGQVQGGAHQGYLQQSHDMINFKADQSPNTGVNFFKNSTQQLALN